MQCAAQDGDDDKDEEDEEEDDDKEGNEDDGSTAPGPPLGPAQPCLPSQQGEKMEFGILDD